MEFNEIKQIIELFSKADVDKLDLTLEGVSLRLAKKKGPTLAAPVEAVTRVVETPAPPPAKEDQEEESDLIFVTSPIVGTFYRAPNPNAEAFVQIGDKVRSGQTMCIVEAMKLMNEIQAEQSGEVVKVLVENGQGVEFGQKLFGLKPL